MHPIQSALSRLVDLGVPGAFAYVEDADGASRFHTAGFADLDTGRRMTPDSRYRVGSTTKTCTAVIILQLVAEGRLALDDTMHDRLPDLGILNARSLTIEQLLRMRSGLFDFEDDPSLLGNLDAHLRPYALSHVVGLGVARPAVFAPGAKYAYCNTNFCVLELIIERVTRHSLAEELATRVFAPLKMASTSYPAEDDLTLPEPYIRGYERTRGGWRECSQVFFGRGDGALISTAIDLGRFFRALLIERTLFPDTLLRKMLHIVPDNPPADRAYGLGLIRDSLPSGEVWGHSGGGFGYRHLPYLRVDTGRFAVFMLNGTYGFRQPALVSVADPPNFSNELRAMAYEDDRV